MRITTNRDGSGIASVSSAAGRTFAVLVQARDFPGGPVESAAAFFSRPELEHFRDQIDAALSEDQAATAAAVRDALPANGDPSN
jgi:hypothetical protein